MMDRQYLIDRQRAGRYPGGRSRTGRRRARRSRASRPWAVLLLALAGAAAVPALAGDVCERELARADQSYQIGRFEDALAAIEACLGGAPGRAEQIAGLELKAKVEIARDDFEDAGHSVAALLRLEPGYAYNQLRDPPRFIALVDELRGESTTVTVSSVSKTPESLRETPATVAVVTAEQIARRGYSNLVEVIEDLSGFDVSRTYGSTYANVYQRGYRSDETNRTLVLVDGVQENDLWFKTVYLSRQFSLANIDRIEVIHGPASTMYGANAFAGVINIITKSPASLLEGGKRFGVHAQVTGGSWDTRVLDALLAGQAAGGRLKWSLTARSFRSDEQDLSDFPDFDWDPTFLEAAGCRFAAFTPPCSQTVEEIYQQNLGRAGSREEIDGFLRENPSVLASGLFTRVDGESGSRIELTPAGLEAAIGLDRTAFGRTFEGRLPGFSNPTDDLLVHGKLEVGNLQVGFQTWRREESWVPQFTDQVTVGDQLWIPVQTWLSARYTRELTGALSLSFFSRFMEHTLDGDTSRVEQSSYFNGALRISDLVAGVEAAYGPRTYFHLFNTEFSNEVKLVYGRSEKFNLVAGLELKNGSIQGDIISSEQPNPSETGQPASELDGGNRFNNRDIGLYAQASYRPWERLKLVAGGRFDDNRIRDTGGFGTVFNPRLAVVYTPRDYALKAIYSEAFQDSSNFNKFFSDTNQIANPSLQPEKVTNLELAFGWQPSEDLSVSVAGYQASYSEVVQLGPCDTSLAECVRPKQQFRGLGEIRIRGAQVDAAWRLGGFELYGNYTYGDPVNVDPTDSNGDALTDDSGAVISEQPSGDIAEHQLNLGFDADFRERLGLSLRLSYVGARRTGAGTSVSANPLEEIDDYTVAHAALSYRNILPHTSLQLIVNNLFDEEYFHPGIRQADGRRALALHPQPERAFYLRVTLDF